MKKTKDIFFIILGGLLVVLGLIGVIIPVLPTTPFLLLASFLFIKSSKRFNEKLLSMPVLGEYIYNYKKYHAVKRTSKIISIIFLWVTLSISIFLVDIIYVRIFLIIVGIAVTIHLLLLNTLENINNDIDQFKE